MARSSVKAQSSAHFTAQHAIAVNGIGATVEVRRHPAARRLTLRVSRTRRAVIVTLPITTDFGEAGHFVERHLDWVRERLDDVPAPMPFCEAGLVPLRGVLHRLRFVGPRSAGGGVVTTVRATTDSAGITELPALEVAGHGQYAPRRLRDWLADEARRDLDARVGWHARTLGLRPRRITLRDQKSRWGSCSSNGQLSFSWRLVLAPPVVLDYVAAHEVAHLAEMNHGPRFWALVRRTTSSVDEAKSWLREHGTMLHRYGAEG